MSTKYPRIIKKVICAWIVSREVKQSRRNEARLDKIEPARAKLRGRYIVARGKRKKASDIEKQLCAYTTNLLRG